MIILSHHLLLCVHLVQHHGRLPPQPTYYVNSSVSPSHSSQAPPTGLGSTPIGLSSTSSSEVRSVSPSPGSHGNHSGTGADRIKQMEQEIHLLRMSVNDKDAQLTQVRWMIVYKSVLSRIYTCECLIALSLSSLFLSLSLSLSPPPSFPPPSPSPSLLLIYHIIRFSVTLATATIRLSS